MSLPNLLKYLLKENVDEVAKSIGDAQSSRLALFRENGYVVLFEPETFYAEMDSLFGDKALENNIAQLQPSIEKMKATITNKLSLDLYIAQLNKLNQKIPLFASSPNKQLAKEINDSLLYINDIHSGSFRSRAAGIRNNPAERLKLNREKEAWERLYNKIIENIYLASDPTYGARNEADHIKTALVNSIRGYIRYVLSDTCNTPTSPKTYQVSYSAASKGWGPLTYDITMSLISPAYLIADRNSNSSDADKVWMYYLKNRPDVHKELMEELITGEDCGLPTSSNEAINNKLNRAQKLLDQRKEPSSKSGTYTRQDLEEIIEELQRSIYHMTRKGTSQNLIDIAQERLEKYQAMLDEMPDETEQKDESRLEDVIEEMKRILADVPQAWRYQISQPISTATLDNRLKLFIDKVKATYGKEVTSAYIKSAAALFFDVNYSPGD
jgi:hypothetical protein